MCLTDYDECLVGNFGCQHRCVNTVGSAFCTCNAGYRLSQNRKSCDGEMLSLYQLKWWWDAAILIVRWWWDVTVLSANEWDGELKILSFFTWWWDTDVLSVQMMVRYKYSLYPKSRWNISDNLYISINYNLLLLGISNNTGLHSPICCRFKHATAAYIIPVSYTHLTLPTILSV